MLHPLTFTFLIDTYANVHKSFIIYMYKLIKSVNSLIVLLKLYLRHSSTHYFSVVNNLFNLENIVLRLSYAYKQSRMCFIHFKMCIQFYVCNAIWQNDHMGIKLLITLFYRVCYFCYHWLFLLFYNIQ